LYYGFSQAQQLPHTLAFNPYGLGMDAQHAGAGMLLADLHHLSADHRAATLSVVQHCLQH
jgi:hypothetical protein